METENGGKRKPWGVFTVIEKGEERFWIRIGAAFVNRDQSLRVQLDALPVNGTMNIQPPKEG